MPLRWYVWFNTDEDRSIAKAGRTAYAELDRIRGVAKRYLPRVPSAHGKIFRTRSTALVEEDHEEARVLAEDTPIEFVEDVRHPPALVVKLVEKQILGR